MTEPPDHSAMAPLVSRAGALHAAGEFVRAESPLERAAAIAPHDAARWRDLAVVRLEIDPRRAGITARRAGIVDPSDARARSVLGAAAARLGRVEAAEAAFRAALVRDPGDFDALRELGASLTRGGRAETGAALVARGSRARPDHIPTLAAAGWAAAAAGRVEEAITTLSAALRRDPFLSSARGDLGEALRRAGRRVEAWVVFRGFAALHPAVRDVVNQTGILALEDGDPATAARLFDRAARLDPTNPSPLVNLGLAQRALGRHREAIAICERILDIDPDNAGALSNLGTLSQERGDLDGAIKAYRRVLARRHDHADTLNNLGLALHAKGRFDEALVMLSRCARERPDFAVAYNNIANVLLDRFQFVEAVHLVRRALTLDPASGEAWSNLGSAYQSQGAPGRAIVCCERALRLIPGLSAAASNRATCLQIQGRTDEALAAFRETLARDPDRPGVRSNMLLTSQYDDTLTREERFAEHRLAGRRLAPPAPAPAPVPRDPAGRRLRVGFLSPDFRAHAVAWFVEPLFRALDRSRFEIFAYAEVTAPDRITNRIMGLVDAWRSTVGLSDDRAAEMIRGDAIDILVDLAGHTSRNRLGVSARKPAPIGVTWLGYPDTTGLDAIDFRLTDAESDPDGAEAFHSERPYRLPDGFLCYGPDPDAPAVGPPPMATSGRPTFGCFNNIAKVGSTTLRAWARILDRLPDARLLLKAQPLTDEDTRTRVLDRLRDAGVPLDRVELRGWVADARGHLALYGEIDAALDTFPYNGTTTTCEALWMGVPVVTRVGDRHAGRVGLSLLTRVGVTEWAAADDDAYVETAVRLVSDPVRLARERAGARERIAASPLVDAPGFARRFESALLDMASTIFRETASDAPVADTTPRFEEPPMTTEEPRDLAARVRDLPFWYHRVAFPGGVTTPGSAPRDPGAHRLPESLDGLRVLDVGAWDGWWSFEALRRGAREVLAIDDLSDRLGLLGAAPERDWRAFDLAREALGWDEARARRLTLDLHDLRPETHGRFDLVLCFGVLNQVRDPLAALDVLAGVCDGEILIEAGVADHFSPYCGGLDQGYAEGHMVMEFYPGGQLGGNPANRWAPTLDCLANMVRAAGFQEVEGWFATERPADLEECRGFVRGRRRAGAVARPVPPRPAAPVSAPGTIAVPDPFRLHIGGVESREGWMILNAAPGPNVDFQGDAGDLSRFPDARCDAIYASHVFEHLPMGRPFADALAGCRRILKPGGELMVSVPDLSALCRLFLGGGLSLDDKHTVTRMMFGGQIDRFDFHYAGYDAELLRRALETAGFRDVRRVDGFDLFSDTSRLVFAGTPISLNMIARR